METGKVPYGLKSFRDMMQVIVRTMLNEKQSDVCIAILSVLNNLDATQWMQTFGHDLTNSVILPFLY
jgi:hypothetical protein